MPVSKNSEKAIRRSAQTQGPGHKAVTDPASHSYVDAPQCKNGVCLVTWKPQRPPTAA